jgi:hypothetical protein
MYCLWLAELPIGMDKQPAAPAETCAQTAEDGSYAAGGCAGCAVLHELAVREGGARENRDEIEAT